jgi:hypothetical protein
MGEVPEQVYDDAVAAYWEAGPWTRGVGRAIRRAAASAYQAGEQAGRASAVAELDGAVPTMRDRYRDGAFSLDYINGWEAAATRLEATDG